jgi:hypothetical protein
MSTTYGRKAWEVRAYTFHGDYLCLECGTNYTQFTGLYDIPNPIFVSDEWDGTDELCGECSRGIN